MLSIGEFSKITGLSTKTLIWYDNIGLLKPDFVNGENGYRFYELKSINKIAQIQFWQTMEFTINDLKNLSNNLIEQKIEQLRDKIFRIEQNIFFLQHLKEENMVKDSSTIFQEKSMAFKTLMCGKWRYETTVKTLKAALERKEGIYDKHMPEYLFFGDGNLGTDLIDTFTYYHDSFSRLIDNIQYNYFLLNSGDKMVVYSNASGYNKMKDVKLHIYRRSGSSVYSDDEINRLLEKYKDGVKTSDKFELNNNLIGHWEMFDQIREGEIEFYDGVQHDKHASFIMPLLFEVLDINKDKSVYVMTGKDDLTIKYSDDDVKTLTKENTKMDIRMCEDGNFVITNHMLNQNHYCVYKQINGAEYIFANLDNNPDLDVEVYIFKKSKVEQSKLKQQKKTTSKTSATKVKKTTKKNAN